LPDKQIEGSIGISNSLSMSKEGADYTLKLILIGSTGVGKTCLVSSYFDNPLEDQVLSTVAPAFTPTIVSVRNVKVSLQIWDTAGQERYQSISQMFYRDSQIAFVCYDSNTFETIDKWVNQLRTNISDCIVFLVSTKADLLSEGDFEAARQKGRDKAQAIGAERHMITSAKTGMGVKELFTEAAKFYDRVYREEMPMSELKSTGSRARPCC
jgi:small GTP-binding protein